MYSFKFAYLRYLMNVLNVLRFVERCYGYSTRIYGGGVGSPMPSIDTDYEYIASMISDLSQHIYISRASPLAQAIMGQLLSSHHLNILVTTIVFQNLIVTDLAIRDLLDD